MDREQLSTFIKAAEDDLASVRSSLLFAAQSGDASGLERSRRLLERLGKGALSCGQPAIASHIADCDAAVDQLLVGPQTSPAAVNTSLDRLAAVEAALLELPLHSDDFLPNVGEFVDDSFASLVPRTEGESEPEPVEDFEIDEETLEIFRGEAEELLGGIDTNIQKLQTDPADQNALWEIRRNAHTVKGAAGIVGLRSAAETAHRMEDLLDRVVELRSSIQPAVLTYLEGSSRDLKAVVDGCGAEVSELDALYAEALRCLASQLPNSSEPTDRAPVALTPGRIEAIKPPTGPIVRVSLDRLDDLIKITRGLLINHSALAERFSDLKECGIASDEIAKLGSLVEIQRKLTDEMQAKLLHIRMVKFGNLETRLARTVHVTCLDEGKLASLEVEGREVEIDTQVIDALIEPLLHLLKNAVVHGIEMPEVRRLVGKPEKGLIRVSVESDENILVMTVKDDGAGIAVTKLKEKALAGAISDRDALKLVFDRGLTTADKVDLNAGRGVGMSIVKEAVETRGGTVHIESEAGEGTEFTIILPLVSAPAAAEQQPEPIEANDELAPLVLVVDDSSTIRLTTSRHVEQAGFRVITANDGAEALELLLNGAVVPDLILSDVEMPQLDGWDFLEYLKTDDHLGHIPVVMVTSLDSDEYRERAFGLGASDYLVKPFGTADIDRVLSIIAPATA